MHAATASLRWCPGRRLAALGTILMLAPLAGACGNRDALSVPVAPWAGHAYLHLAASEGFDRAAGTRLRIQPFEDPQKIVQAWLRGELSLAPLTGVEVVDICSRRPDRCPVVVLVLDESRGADQLIVRRSISDLRDLKGRRVGVSPSSLGPYVTSRALESVGLDIADVRLVAMEPEAFPSALHHGRIDAAATFPPFSNLVLSLGIARVAFDSTALPGEILDLLVVDPRFLREHRDDLARFLLAWEWARSWARREPDLASTALARLQKVSVTGLRRAEAGLLFFPLAQQRSMLAPGGSVAAGLAAVQRVQQDLGIVGAGALMPAVSDELVERALQLAVNTEAPK
jgi:NitT/TauT family transport system substrate-binding protein